MRRAVRWLFGVLVGLCLAALLVPLVSSSARQLAPSWLFYDLVGRQFSPLPAGAEQWLLASGQEFCAAGHDSDCGGYKIIGARTLPIGKGAPPDTVAAWCVDYVVLRRNQGRLTSSWIYWANIPRAAIITQSSAGSYEASPNDNCRTATLERQLPHDGSLAEERL